MNKKDLFNVIKRFWFIAVAVAYFLTNNWVLGNFILLYIGFSIGKFWSQYKALVVIQGEALKAQWGLNKHGEHKDDSDSPKGYA
jgi:uncharacterized membrane protein